MRLLFDAHQFRHPKRRDADAFGQRDKSVLHDGSECGRSKGMSVFLAACMASRCRLVRTRAVQAMQRTRQLRLITSRPSLLVPPLKPCSSHAAWVRTRCQARRVSDKASCNTHKAQSQAARAWRAGHRAFCFATEAPVPGVRGTTSLQAEPGASSAKHSAHMPEATRVALATQEGWAPGSLLGDRGLGHQRVGPMCCAAEALRFVGRVFVPGG